MEIAPINSLSLNIGTPTSVRAPASLATAELAKGSSAVTSAMWMIRFVSKRWRRGVIPPIGIFGTRRSRRSSNARGAPCIATIRNSPPWTSGEIGEVGLANAGCVRQNRSEDPVQLARRARNDLQHLGGRRLLLQRLGELLFQVGIGCAKAVNVSFRLR